MAQISKDTKIGELLNIFPESAPDPDGDWNALSRMPGIPDGDTRGSSYGTWH